MFSELDEVTPGHAILASNTSSLSITEMGEATSRPDKVVGFHFFYPASAMRLIEVIEGEDTSTETGQAASSFAQAIRKMPIRCGEAPGFVVNRILNSSAAELWRFQEESGVAIEELDKIVAESKEAPMGPFFLADVLGLDTVLGVAKHLRASYGDRFFVHAQMQQLVAAGNLGAKTGKGFYEHGPDTDSAALVDRFTLKALVESCLVLEEGVASMKDIDLGMMAGAGIIPPPFARADQIGLDTVLGKLEQAAQDWGENFEPPTILRRLVAQGRLGVKAGQGFFPYARPDPGWDESPVKLETRVRLRSHGSPARPRTRSRRRSFRPCRRSGTPYRSANVRAFVFASANPMLFCAGADIKAFTMMDAAAGKDLLDRMHSLLRQMETSSVATVAAVNAGAFGGGCELAMAWTSGSPPSLQRSASRRSPLGSFPASAAPSGCRASSGRPRRSR